MRKIDAEARVARANRRVGEFLQVVTEGRGAKGLPDGVVERITIRLPTKDQPEALLTIKATGSSGPHVAFIGGLDVVQALLIWAAKDAGSGLRWREDRPWSGE